MVLEQLPEYAMNPDKLIGTRWRCVSVNGKPVTQGIGITLFFKDAITATGRAGCFDSTYHYTAIGDNIRWGNMTSRNGECSQKEELAAAEYDHAASVAASYRLSPDKLEIFSVRGDVLVYIPQ